MKVAFKNREPSKGGDRVRWRGQVDIGEIRQKGNSKMKAAYDTPNPPIRPGPRFQITMERCTYDHSYEGSFDAS